MREGAYFTEKLSKSSRYSFFPLDGGTGIAFFETVLTKGSSEESSSIFLTFDPSAISESLRLSCLDEDVL